MKPKYLYKKYSRNLLNMNEMCAEIGISTSKAYKFFSLYGEKTILKYNLLPQWKTIGKQRKWHIKQVSKWCES